MNIPATELFVDGIRSIPKQDIKSFFEAARNETYQFLRRKEGEGSSYSLTDIQARVILLDELENYFLLAKDNKTKKTAQL